MIIKTNQQVHKNYLGSTNIFKVYAGENLVFGIDDQTPEQEETVIELDGLKYEINEDGNTVTVIAYTGNLIQQLNIPETITSNNKTFTVTAIKENAFRLLGTLRDVDIPDTVTTIGNYAFYSTVNLGNIVIGEGIQMIGTWSFYNSSIQSITIKATTPPQVQTASVSKSFGSYSYPIYVPEESLQDYKTAWPVYADRLFAIQDETD